MEGSIIYRVATSGWAFQSPQDLCWYSTVLKLFRQKKKADVSALVEWNTSERNNKNEWEYGWAKIEINKRGRKERAENKPKIDVEKYGLKLDKEYGTV